MHAAFSLASDCLGLPLTEYGIYIPGIYKLPCPRCEPPSPERRSTPRVSAPRRHCLPASRTRVWSGHTHLAVLKMNLRLPIKDDLTGSTLLALKMSVLLEMEMPCPWRLLPHTSSLEYNDAFSLQLL